MAGVALLLSVSLLGSHLKTVVNANRGLNFSRIFNIFFYRKNELGYGTSKKKESLFVIFWYCSFIFNISEENLDLK